MRQRVGHIIPIMFSVMYWLVWVTAATAAGSMNAPLNLSGNKAFFSPDEKKEEVAILRKLNRFDEAQAILAELLARAFLLDGERVDAGGEFAGLEEGERLAMGVLGEARLGERLRGGLALLLEFSGEFAARAGCGWVRAIRARVGGPSERLAHLGHRLAIDAFEHLPGEGEILAFLG